MCRTVLHRMQTKAFTVSVMQVLDGQSVSDADRSAAADFAATQAQLQASTSAAAQESEATPPSALPSSSPSRVSKAAGLPGKGGLPSSPGRPKGIQAVRSKSNGGRIQTGKGAAIVKEGSMAAPADAARSTGMSNTNIYVTLTVDTCAPACIQQACKTISFAWHCTSAW